MAGLLYKELIINKKNLMYIFVIYLIMPMMMLLVKSNSEDAETTEMFMPLFMIMMFFYVFFLVFMMIPNNFETDENKKWAYFISSSPKLVKGQIGAKYLMAFIIYFVLQAFCMLSAALYEFVYKVGSVVPLCAVMNAVMSFLVLFLHALEFPFIVRFGFKNGSNIKALLFLVIISVAIVYALFGDLSVFGSLDHFFERIMNLLSGKGLSDTTLFVLSIAPYLVLAVYYLSYRISCSFYLKGAENFEK